MTLPLQLNENVFEKTDVSLSYNLIRAEQVRQHELAAAASLNCGSYALMQRAGAAALQCIQAYYPLAQKILVLVGSGNNGGDGYIVASLARQQGLNVIVASADPERLVKGDALQARALWLHDEGMIFDSNEPDFNEFDLVVDALLGTGLQGVIRPPMMSIIEKINRCKVPVLSLDVPSGMHSDTGAALPLAVEAQRTVTFVAIKPGSVTGVGKHYCGQLILADLAIAKPFHAMAKSAAQLISWSTLARLSQRQNHANKGNFGRLVCFGGNQGMAGAICLTATAALRSGAGLVKVFCHEHSQALVANSQREIMLNTATGIAAIKAALDWSTCVVLGPGLGTDAWSHSIFEHVLAYLSHTAKPVIIDADGLNLLAKKWQTNQRIKLPACVLTPHPGEAARLLGLTVQEIEQDRYAASQAISARYGAVCVLKGAGTIISQATDDGACLVCADGNPGMATAGMGDVLSGVIGAMLGQGMSAVDAASYGVCLHANAGDRVASDYGQRGMIASDLFQPLRAILNYR
ncbi:NAD(P)H-hydrate dehydratase [Paraglaciecola sp.]|uniref:NAD(P)H-hydrate dehydratase n=1 Tax=Paraglaciecola sp. TaxID=1920173 RepID=UPI00273DFD06|nr:NAD(P)H-hydrate dehydratase [Paraglaciecola sp.]MDP5029275.1 NAD(P)H-hydrate dehydratase [Paraglaciecola sp.]